MLSPALNSREAVVSATMGVRSTPSTTRRVRSHPLGVQCRQGLDEEEGAGADGQGASSVDRVCQSTELEVSCSSSTPGRIIPTSGGTLPMRADEERDIRQ